MFKHENALPVNNEGHARLLAAVTIKGGRRHIQHCRKKMRVCKRKTNYPGVYMDIFTPFVSTTSNELCCIMEKYGSDKGSGNMNGWHNYTTLYHPLFSPVRDSVKNVFEMGLGTNYTDIPSNMGVNGKPGASHRGWAEYFPNARIYGADIDKRVLFNDDRISTYYCDQLNKDIIKDMWLNMPQEFDIIVDDGLHTFDANKCLFDNSHHKLAVGGVYVIEDIIFSTIPLFTKQIELWKIAHPTYSFNLVKLSHHKNMHDNCLLLIKRNT